MLFRVVPREHWLIYDRNVLKARFEFTMKKVRPALYHSTLRSVLTSDKFVSTHGFLV